MPYFPPPLTGFVPLNGSLPMTGTLTTPGVIASSPGSAAAPAFAVNTNYGIFFDSTNTALGIATAGVENAWFSTAGLTLQRTGAASSLIINADATAQVQVTQFSTNTNPALINGRKARGTMAAPLVVATNDILLQQTASGWDGVSAFQTSNTLRSIVIEPTPGPTAMGGRFQILVTPLGAVVGTEVARFEPAAGFSMYGANPVVDINRTIFAGSGTTAALPAVTQTGGLRYVTDLEGGSGYVYSGIGNVYRSMLDGQVATATPSGVGVLTEFTGFCDYTYRNIVLNTHAMLTRAGLLTGKLLGFYVFAVPTNQNDALINWATPGTRNATITGTPVFTANQGFTGDSATALVTMGGTLANLGASVSNVCAGAYVLVANTAGAAERAVIGQNNGAQGRRTQLTSFTSGNLHSNIMVQTATGDVYTPPRYTGMFAMNRSLALGATSYTDSVDDIAPTTIGTASATLGSAICWLGTNDSSGTSFSNAQVAFGFVGANMTTADIANLRVIMRDYYLTQIGAIPANYTVALLPLVTSVPAGTKYNVTDATVTTFASTVVGGGTNFVPVTNNGTNWIIG